MNETQPPADEKLMPPSPGIFPCTVLTDQGPESHCCMFVRGHWYWWVDDGLSAHWELVTDYNCAVVAWEHPMQHSNSVPLALSDVLKERRCQDVKWGGPAHDDEHVPEDWERFIMKRIPVESKPDETFRLRMVQIAALALAAVESFDRKKANNE
jgi:hypothetical protein